MKKAEKSTVIAVLASVAFAAFASHAEAEAIAANLAGKAFYCKGGNESGGHDYFFRVGQKAVERIDYRFPNHKVVFTIGRAQRGRFDKHWSYETLSEQGSGRIHLYERVSLRSGVDKKHIYRTYEIMQKNGGITMILYDGVNGARDWKQKTTRDCGMKSGNKIVRSKSNKFWSTTLF